MTTETKSMETETNKENTMTTETNNNETKPSAFIDGSTFHVWKESFDGENTDFVFYFSRFSFILDEDEMGYFLQTMTNRKTQTRMLEELFEMRQREVMKEVMKMEN